MSLIWFQVDRLVAGWETTSPTPMESTAGGRVRMRWVTLITIVHVENCDFDSDDEVGSSVKITTLAFVKMAKITMFVK